MTTNAAGISVRSELAQDFQVELTNSHDTRVSLEATGAMTQFEIDGFSLLQYPASPMADGAAGLWLRVHGAEGVQRFSLFGQDSSLVRDCRAAGTGTQGDQRRVDRRCGRVGDLEVAVELRLSDERAAWYWHIAVRNCGDRAVTVDWIYAHDVALATPGAVRNNEYYVSQYLDVSPIQVPSRGVALGVRQNMPGPTPWVLIGGLREVVGWATDLIQLTGHGRPEGTDWPGLRGDLPCHRRQGEHTVAALQTSPITISPLGTATSGFYGIFQRDHQAATGPDDVRHAEAALADPAAAPIDVPVDGVPSPFLGDQPVTDVDHRSWLGSVRNLAVRTAPEAELNRWTGTRSVRTETDGGHLLAYFAEDGTHLVTAAKQSRVLRPHGQLLRTGTNLTPDERNVTTTVWMDGSFCSHLTQGHVSLGMVLSLRRSYLGLNPAHGLRLLVRVPGAERWELLGTPSAWQQGLDFCRWWYAPTAPDGASGRTHHPEQLQSTIEVTTRVPAGGDGVTVGIRTLDGEAIEILAAAHLTWNDPDCPLGPLDLKDGSVTVRPDSEIDFGNAAGPDPRVTFDWSGAGTSVADDAMLFRDARSRQQPWLTFVVQPTTSWQLTVTPTLIEPPSDRSVAAERRSQGPSANAFWPSIAGAVKIIPPATPAGAELGAIEQVVPWFAHDALIHYLSPRGLEQYSGGGWGTRDVSQGPVGLLLALGAHQELRSVLKLIMGAQNVRGDWPQAFQFLDQQRRGQADAHGDVVYWPLSVMGQYLAATGDGSILDEHIPFTGDDGPTAPATVLDHLVAAVDHIESTLVDGTGLPAYGHGDWNDSLQPANPELAERMVSSWTAVLQTQTLRELANELAVGSATSRSAELARRMERLAVVGADDLHRLLQVDGVLSGYGVFHGTGHEPEAVIHPTDVRTGLRYSLLPMIHAISADLLTPQEADHHLSLIEDHLLAPDGVRLFDRPVRYQGGPMTIFQRAEASTFFGREIGLMYMHAHLRYAEALARVGDGPRLLRALACAQPVGVTDRISGARPRQSTCYYSSSDAAFDDRAAADQHYDDVVSGRVAFEGGWRVYSSGPGLYLWLLTSRLLGIRTHHDRIEIDPVLDPGLDGLTVELPVAGTRCSFRFRTGERGHGVAAVRAGGEQLIGRPLTNRYRRPGVAVPLEQLLSVVQAGGEIEVETD